MTAADTLRAAMFACPPGCSCRGEWRGPERRAVHRDPCKYCAGTGTLVYQDEAQPCWCQQPDADVRA